MIPSADDPCRRRVPRSDGDLAGAALTTRLLVPRPRGDIRGAPVRMGACIKEPRGFIDTNGFAHADAARF